MNYGVSICFGLARPRLEEMLRSFLFPEARVGLSPRINRASLGYFSTEQSWSSGVLQSSISGPFFRVDRRLDDAVAPAAMLCSRGGHAPAANRSVSGGRNHPTGACEGSGRVPNLAGHHAAVLGFVVPRLWCASTTGGGVIITNAPPPGIGQSTGRV